MFAIDRAEVRLAITDSDLVIGLIAGKFWSAVVTQRNDKIRITSVRKSRSTEVALYES